MADNNERIAALLAGVKQPEPDPPSNALAGYNQELMEALMNPPKREPWAWTKDYPTSASFLKEALAYAPLGFAGLRGGAPLANRLAGPSRASPPMAMPEPPATPAAPRALAVTEKPGQRWTDQGFVPDANRITLEVTSPAGRINADVDRVGRTIDLSSRVNDGMQGQGHGVALYRALADYAAKNGLEIRSANPVTIEAARMYEALQRRGYDVVRHPKAVTDRVTVGVSGEPFGQDYPFVVRPKSNSQ